MLLTLKDIYDDETAKTSLGAAFDYLESIVVDPGHLMVIQLAAVENTTNNYTNLLFGVKMADNFQALADEATPSAAGVYWLADKILVPAGHTFTSKLVGCTAADYIRMHLQGYIYLLGE